MVLRTCERCGQIEAAQDDERLHRIDVGGEQGGESCDVCTRCYVELCGWFYDAQPEQPVELATSKS